MRLAPYACFVSDEPDKGFQVVDRRRFDEKGETREEGLADSPEEARPEARTEARTDVPTEARDPKAASPHGEAGAAAPSRSEPIDFATFLLSLSSSAFYYLGDVPHPGSGRVERDIGLAKQTIDLLGMLQEKTKGNLTEEESQVLTGLLYELRMRYVDELRKEKPSKIV
jgi:uncharacterized protein DUF1844